MGFPWQESWSGLPYPSPGDPPTPGVEPMSPELVGGCLTAEPPGKSCKWWCFCPKVPTGKLLWWCCPTPGAAPPVMAPCLSHGRRLSLSASSVPTVRLLHPGERRATVLTFSVLTPANPLTCFPHRLWSPAYSSTQVNLPAREGAPQGVETFPPPQFPLWGTSPIPIPFFFLPYLILWCFSHPPGSLRSSSGIQWMFCAKSSTCRCIITIFVDVSSICYSSTILISSPWILY